MYFGKTYKGAKPGLATREKVQIFVALSALMILLTVVLLNVNFGGDEEKKDFKPFVPQDQVLPGDLVDLPPLPNPNVEPKQDFDPDTSILGLVKDLQEEDGAREVVHARDFLFQRWRLGLDAVKAEALPPRESLREAAHGMRGMRFPLYLDVVKVPELIQGPYEEDGGGSGVKQYYEMLGTDDNNLIHRILFVNKSQDFEVGDSIFLEGDFLRIYRYQSLGKGMVSAPEFLALEVLPHTLKFTRPKWESLGVVFAITMLGIVVMLIYFMRS